MVVTLGSVQHFECVSVTVRGVLLLLLPLMVRRVELVIMTAGRGGGNDGAVGVGVILSVLIFGITTILHDLPGLAVVAAAGGGVALQLLLLRRRLLLLLLWMWGVLMLLLV